MVARSGCSGRWSGPFSAGKIEGAGQTFPVTVSGVPAAIGEVGYAADAWSFTVRSAHVAPCNDQPRLPRLP